MLVNFAGLLTYNLNNKIIVDLGCGTGFLTKHLSQTANVQQIIAIDIALSMLNFARIKLNQQKKLQYVCADAEKLPLNNHAIDVIYSNLTLQWCQNLISVFNGFNQALKSGGKLLFSTFGVATLYELKHAWAKVDAHTHVNNFYTAKDIVGFLHCAGFSNITLESKRYKSNYHSVIDLMRELKGMGAHHVISGRNPNPTSKIKLQCMINIYENYRTKGLIPATYEIIFVAAKA